ncbi:hypothetical protein [Oscillatoria sp. FACHB-1407]|nr:hypothetical protein [Oscillatoria sp. FACHB-1407]
MGTGLALQFKQAFPEDFEEYQRGARMAKSSQGRCLSCRQVI